LNILIKLMSIVSLLIAPLMEGDDDWDTWYYGVIPLAAMVLATMAVYHFFWRVKLDITAAPASAQAEEITKETPKVEPLDNKDEVEAEA
jgi:hypothetical protein